MTQEALRMALEKIATVNAMDYEYQAWAREALAQTQEPDVQETLHWHAFNYRQAHIVEAHEMWEKLEQFVNCKIKPPQRTWVGLTDDDRLRLWLKTESEDVDRYAFAKAVEAAIKELNT